jgi:hypothetical protein
VHRLLLLLLLLLPVKQLEVTIPPQQQGLQRLPLCGHCWQRSTAAAAAMLLLLLLLLLL